MACFHKRRGSKIDKSSRIAFNVLSSVVLSYDYVYDPDHKKKPSGGSWKQTEEGWSKDREVSNEITIHPSFELKEKVDQRDFSSLLKNCNPITTRLL